MEGKAIFLIGKFNCDFLSATKLTYNIKLINLFYIRALVAIRPKPYTEVSILTSYLFKNMLPLLFFIYYLPFQVEIKHRCYRFIIFAIHCEQTHLRN